MLSAGIRWTLDLTLDSAVNSANAQMEILDPQAADLPERKKRFPSWVGAEKSAADLNFSEKNGIFVATGQDPARSK